MAVIVGCVLGAGAALYAASRSWLVRTTLRPAPQPPLVEHLTGGSLLPLLPALGLVALAGAGGVIASRGLVRAGIGALITAAGLGIVFIERGVVGLAGLTVGWVLLATVGGILISTAGAFTLRNGRRWPVMGARYERAGGVEVPGTGITRSDGASTPDGAPAGVTRPVGNVGATDGPTAGARIGDSAWWDAIDRGEDPTKA
jgi:Tryptophan-associated transmembrane protein (Trp_oprn_chp)